MVRRRVRSLKYGIQYEINDWNRADFAKFYCVKDDKKYNMNMEQQENKYWDHVFQRKYWEYVRFLMDIDNSLWAVSLDKEITITDRISGGIKEKQLELVKSFVQFIEQIKCPEDNEIDSKNKRDIIQQYIDYLNGTNKIIIEGFHDTFKSILEEEVNRSVRLKEQELFSSFAETMNLKRESFILEIMDKEINRRVKENEEVIKQKAEAKMEAKYKEYLELKQMEINRLNNKLGKNSNIKTYNKPLKSGKTFVSKYKSECLFCKKTIVEGEPICPALFSNGKQAYVHEDCCEHRTV